MTEVDARLTLAPKTKAVYEFVKAEVEAGRPFPGAMEITRHMKWQHHTAAHDCLLRLASWGKIKLEKNPQWSKFGGRRYFYELAE